YSRALMHSVYDKAKRRPKRIVFPEGDHEKIIRAARILAEEGIAHPILLGKRDELERKLSDLDIAEGAITIIDPEQSPDLERYIQRFHEIRRRSGVTLSDARTRLTSRNYFAMLMMDAGDADGAISGLRTYYPATIRPALQVISTRPTVRRVSGAYILVFKSRLVILADTTVNIEPSAEDLAEIAILTAETAKRFELEPRIAMLSFSNFGSTKHPLQDKVRRAVEIVRTRHPDLAIEGEMQADIAVMPDIAKSDYPWSVIQGDANVLICPDLQSANIAYKLLWRLGGAEAIGPILQGLSKPVHVLQRGVDVSDIVNMAAIAVIDAQEIEDRG
ncbi:MAG TPA: phosphate acyltransferase, partial [Thermoanaerobaculia bacterium]|nr:phosphate acyltransferase [Thermoanaerobaculia bacterium]